MTRRFASGRRFARPARAMRRRASVISARGRVGTRSVAQPAVPACRSKAVVAVVRITTGMWMVRGSACSCSQSWSPVRGRSRSLVATTSGCSAAASSNAVVLSAASVTRQPAHVKNSRYISRTSCEVPAIRIACRAAFPDGTITSSTAEVAYPTSVKARFQPRGGSNRPSTLTCNPGDVKDWARLAAARIGRTGQRCSIARSTPIGTSIGVGKPAMTKWSSPAAGAS